jgi:hypothetical protein
MAARPGRTSPWFMRVSAIQYEGSQYPGSISCARLQDDRSSRHSSRQAEGEKRNLVDSRGRPGASWLLAGMPDVRNGC